MYRCPFLYRMKIVGAVFLKFVRLRLWLRPSLVAIVAAQLGLTACGTLPSGAPTVGQVSSQVGPNSPSGIASVKATLPVVNTLKRIAASESPGSGFFQNSGALETTLGAGDLLSITVIEQVAGGLFSGSNSNATEHGANMINLPVVQIDGMGMISVPYLGPVKAAGMTEQSLGRFVQDGLASKTPSPVVMVHRAQDLSNTVLVTGIIRTSGPVQLTPAGETLLDVISRAGGSSIPPSDTMVKMTRRGETRSVRLSTLQDQPRANILLQRDDVISLESAVQKYTVLGAALVKSTRPLPSSGMSLAEVIGEAGGLDDGRADGKGVYVLRFERRNTLVALGVAIPSAAPPAEDVPTIYQFDMGSVDGIFAAQTFAIRASDVVLVANAEGVGLTKAIQLFSNVAQPVSTTAAIADRLKAE